MVRVLSLLLLSAMALAAQSDDAVLEHLRADYVNHWFLIRGFYQDPLLHYDPAGTLTHRAESGSWTTSFFTIKSIRLDKARLELRGVRGVETFNDHKRIFERHGTDVKLLLTIDAASPANEDEIRKALAVVFIGAKEPIAPMLPDYWQWVIAHLDKDGVLPKLAKNSTPPNEPCPPDPSPDKPCRVGGAVKPPKPISTPDPAFNEYARAFHLNGTTVLWVSIDETGHPHKLLITKPLGCGVDESALERVKEWRFQPATRDGHPVPVQINVEVNYAWR